MLKIGISSCFIYPDKKRKTYWKKQLCFAEKDFFRFWSSFGVLPVLIPDLEKEELSSFVDQLDGIALHGGVDLDPATYQQPPINKEQWPGDAYRDGYELEIVRLAMEKGLPIFGVCRGAQLLNAYFGGTLYQDLPTEFESSIAHYEREAYDLNTHPIRIVPGKLLDNLGVKVCRVNSIHHQAVKQLGDNLEVLATAENGLVEAFQWTGGPEGFVVGVQWHPEFSKHARVDLLDDKLLVSKFLEHCLARIT